MNKIPCRCFQDRNDIPPVFTTAPPPVTLDDEVPIGTRVAALLATDSDGTAPGNKVSLFLSTWNYWLMDQFAYVFRKSNYSIAIVTKSAPFLL